MKNQALDRRMMAGAMFMALALANCAHQRPAFAGVFGPSDETAFKEFCLKPFNTPAEGDSEVVLSTYRKLELDEPICNCVWETVGPTMERENFSEKVKEDKIPGRLVAVYLTAQGNCVNWLGPRLENYNLFMQYYGDR
jgi:hypothetical protein